MQILEIQENKMNKIFMVAILTISALFGASVVGAQERDLQGYVGAQYVRTNLDNNTGFSFNRETDTVGVNGSVTGFLNNGPAGLTGEVSANFSNNGSGANLYTAMGGLTLQARNEKFQPFVRGLAGASRVKSGNPFGNFLDNSDTGFAFAVGGGVDIKVADNLAIRVIQADYMQTRHFGARVDNLRLGAGLRF